MHKLVKYITALLLLLIFPFSAFSLNIKISRCNHSGRISLIINNTSSSACKCCSNLKNLDALHKYHSSLNEKSCEYQHQCCHETGKGSKSACCNQSITSLDKENQDKEQKCFSLKSQGRPLFDNNKVFDLPKAHIESKCCSNSIVSGKINVMFSNLEIFKKSLNHSLKHQHLPNLISYHLLNLKPSANERIVQYPLKGPLCGIISFIYYSFLSGNDIDPNSNYVCLT